jgi:hypothetical protein
MQLNFFNPLIGALILYFHNLRKTNNKKILREKLRILSKQEGVLVF